MLINDINSIYIHNKQDNPDIWYNIQTAVDEMSNIQKAWNILKLFGTKLIKEEKNTKRNNKQYIK